MFWVGLICRVPQTCSQGIPHLTLLPRRRRPFPSTRRLRDDLLIPEIARLHAENYGVHRRRKMHALMRRQRWEIGLDQTERLMHLAGERGVKKSKRASTTRPDEITALPTDLVDVGSPRPRPTTLGV